MNQRQGVNYLEVNSELFESLLNNQAGDYLIFGNPPIKVYRVGTREAIEHREQLSPEERTRVLNGIG